jgi:8-oxo-dGTP pyrophosphatase MutT (NUDIX family)
MVDPPDRTDSAARPNPGRRPDRTEASPCAGSESVPWPRVDDLLARYDPATSAEASDVSRVRHLITAVPDPWQRTLPLHTTASAVIVHPPTQRVLLRWHHRQDSWLAVGGHAEPGETRPLAVALREAHEETGLNDLLPWPDASLRHVAIVTVAASTREPAHEHADLRFLLATGEPDTARPENPTAQLRWLSLSQASATTDSPSLRETLTRLGRLMDAGL